MRLWTVVLFACFAPSSFAQDCVVTLPLGAFIKDSQRLPALRPLDLNVNAGNKPVTIRSVDSLPVRRFVIVVDASTSMRGESRRSSYKYQFARAIALSLAKQAPSEAQVGLVTFGAGPFASVGPGQDPKAIKQALEETGEVTKTGLTPLWDAIAEAHHLLQPALPGDFIVVLTDGGSNTGKLARIEVTSMLASKGIRVFPILLADAQPRTIEEYHGSYETNELAEQTGGIQLSIEMPGRGHLTYETPADIVGKRTLAVASKYYQAVGDATPDQAGKKLSIKVLESVRGLKLVYPRNLMACR